MSDLQETVTSLIKPDYVRPAAAWDLMRTAKQTKRTVYISGETGFGKTSFVANYLARRKFDYYSPLDMAELDRATNAIMNREEPVRERVIIIDDLQLLDDEAVREEYANKIRRLSANPFIWLILISRAPVPKWLKTVYIDSVFLLIGQKELGLSQEETEAFLEHWNVTPSTATLRKMAAQGKGAPLYLRCAAIQLGSISASTQQQRALMEEEALKRALDDLYDYIEVHIYDNWDLDFCDFLMDMSVVKDFDVAMARTITRRGDVEQMLQRIREADSFLTETTESNVVWYHFSDIAADSLHRRLYTKQPRSHVDMICNSAGSAYEMAGDFVAALEMYREGGDEESTYRLLLANARKYVGSGYYWGLRRYYLELDEARIRTSPELMGAMSLLHSILMDDEESERWYQELVDYTQRQSGMAKKTAQERLLSLDVALPHRDNLKMLDVIKNIGAIIGGKGVLPELSIVNSSPSIMNGGRDFCDWSKNDLEIAKKYGTVIAMILGGFGKGLINLAMAESSFEKGRDKYQVSGYINQGRVEAEGGGKIDLIYVAVGLSYKIALLDGHCEDALEMLETFRQTAAKDAPYLLDGIDTDITRVKLYSGDYGDILSWVENAPNEDLEFCTLERYRYLAKIRSYLAVGKKEKAISLIQRMQVYAEKRQRNYIMIELLMLRAIAEYRLSYSCWKETFQQAITKAEELHFVRVLSQEGAAVMPLLEAAEFTWSDEGFKEQVYAETNKMKEYYPKYLRERQNDIGLSEMAVKILKMMDKGYTIQEIADRLSITPSGVKYYNTETYKKLGVRGKTEALLEAKNRKLI